MPFSVMVNVRKLPYICIAMLLIVCYELNRMLIGCVCSLLPSSLKMDDDIFIDRWGTFFDEISQLLTGADRQYGTSNTLPIFWSALSYVHMCAEFFVSVLPRLMVTKH